MSDATAILDDGSGRTMASALETTLRRDIIAGLLEPGSKLRVRELGERYGTWAPFHCGKHCRA